MKRFPLEPVTPERSAELLRNAGNWGDNVPSVEVPQFPRLAQVVTDISRTPAGSRVAECYRNVHIWGEDVLSSRLLPPDGAAGLYMACRREAGALLDMGYPRHAGLDFITDLPGPGSNPVRSPAQCRAALHHLGGDIELFREMVERPVPGHSALKMVFSVWPREGRIPVPWTGREEPFSLLLVPEGDGVPGVVSLSPRLLGYVLLCCYDLAARLEHRAGSRGPYRSFAGFAAEFVR